jgi:hypothetical protein
MVPVSYGTQVRFPRIWLCGLIAAGAALVAAPAVADPATTKVLQLGVGFRYGADLTSGDTLNPWGTGIGLDGGYTLPNAVFLGASFEYFFGEKIGDDSNGASANLWQLSTEAGYDLGTDVVVLRPKLGLGVANVSVESCAPAVSLGGGSDCTPRTKSDFVLLPGATLIVIPGRFSLVADVRYELVFASQMGQGLLFTFGVGL